MLHIMCKVVGMYGTYQATKNGHKIWKVNLPIVGYEYSRPRGGYRHKLKDICSFVGGLF